MFAEKNNPTEVSVGLYNFANFTLMVEQLQRQASM